MKKRVIIIIMFLIITVLSVMNIKMKIAMDKLNKINYTNTETMNDSKTISKQTEEQEIVKEGMVKEIYEEIQVSEEVQKKLVTYRNILVLGIDSRQDIYSDSRSDCIIIVSINEVNHEIKLISVYRDTYLKIYDKSLDKITHAYAYGGSNLAIKSLNLNMDLDITEFITVNFDAVIKIINKIGGIELEVTDEEAKYITGVEHSGRYNLNGEQVLEYSRIRYTSGGDYKRTERMRDVFKTVFEKVKNMNTSEKIEVLDDLLPEVYTNISRQSIEELIPIAKEFKIVDDIGWPYSVQGITLDRWYGVPVTLEENVIKLHNEIFNNPKYQPSDNVKNISNQIIEKTGYK